MLFAILFGLSMDYEVFLISRIHEEWLASGDNRTAVRKGLASTGKTITAAALIMILVFGSFILGGRAGDQGVRARTGGGHPHGRRPHPYGHRSRADVHDGQVQLVVPGLARPDPAPPGSSTPTCPPPSNYPKARPHRPGRCRSEPPGTGSPLDNRGRRCLSFTRTQQPSTGGTHMADFVMTIGGDTVPAPESFGVVNPANGEVFAQAPECSPQQLDAAFDAASKAQRDWKSDESARRATLLRMADVLLASSAELAPVLTAEQGKPLSEANIEVFASAIWCQYFANLETPPQVIQDDDEALVEVARRPVGVVAAITPWNFPLTLAFWKIAPALMAGNTLVLKPSPFTPLTTLKVAELLREVVPPGVLNVVSGGDQLGAWMTGHPVPRKISFTGSVETGKLVAQSAAPDLKRVTLELGGNDPAIVLDDADPAVVSKGIFAAAFNNNGQVCSAIKRVYVPESLYDDVVDGLAAQATSVKVGDGADADTKLGPINNRPQFERVKELVGDAVTHGARAVTGGRAMDRPGYFFEPTILAGLSDGTRIVDEEQFGPALPVISYRDVDDVIDRANATHFGLSGSVWGADSDRATEVAGQLECGTAWVNTHLALGPQQPFGGFKWSGVGVENGPWGLAEFTEIQVVHRSKGADGLNVSTAGLVS